MGGSAVGAVTAGSGGLMSSTTSGTDAAVGAGVGRGGGLGGGVGSGWLGAGGITGGSVQVGVSVILGGAAAGRGALGFVSVSEILKGVAAGLVEGRRGCTARAGVGVCAGAPRGARTGCRVPALFPALGPVAAGRARRATGLGRTPRGLLATFSTPGIFFRVLSTLSSSSWAMVSSLCCSATSCCRLSSVARSPAASDATISRWRTYPCIPL